jgi:hypothetical protein
MGSEQFDRIIGQLEAATADDLGDPDDHQLDVIADLLSEAAEMIRASKVGEPE